MLEKIQLRVEGMSCGHCVKAVENSLAELKGVDYVTVTLADGIVDISYDVNLVSLNTIKDIIVEEGYSVL